MIATQGEVKGAAPEQPWECTSKASGTINTSDKNYGGSAHPVAHLSHIDDARQLSSLANAFNPQESPGFYPSTKVCNVIMRSLSVLSLTLNLVVLHCIMGT